VKRASARLNRRERRRDVGPLILRACWLRQQRTARAAETAAKACSKWRRPYRRTDNPLLPLPDLTSGLRRYEALKAGADLVIINRFGKRERDGKGLAFLIDRALDADIAVVIAVSSKSFADWIKFSGGMSVKLACDRTALDAWWRKVSLRDTAAIAPDHTSVCEALK
jgi:hypothetical protein